MKYLSYKINNNIINYYYEIDAYHFTHQVIFEDSTPLDPNLAFHLGLAEMFSYWKLTCSPIIEISAGYLSTEQIAFWHKLLINGMGQYFYENKIDFTKKDFVNFKVTASELSSGTQHLRAQFTADNVLVPIGGGKDSIVTFELLKNNYNIRPIVVHPASPASDRLVKNPVVVRRVLDPKIMNSGFLKGHIPYSAILAFVFLLSGCKYIAVSNERSSDEGNVEYLGQRINHQYSKSLEFETDFNNYIADTGIKYFSFLRPLYELQIAKIFSRYPQYFSKFRSCNRNQQQDSWCGHCPKCLSIGMTLRPWTSPEVIQNIFGFDPLTDASNQQLLSELTDPSKTKPFECVTTFEEAQVCLEFIKSGPTDRVKEFLNRWGPSPNTPPEFITILKDAYHS